MREWCGLLQKEVSEVPTELLIVLQAMINSR